MRFEDESYVRLYKTDTLTWKKLTWQGKALLPLILRKMDRAGLMDIEGDRVEGVAIMVDMPVDLVAIGLPDLVSRQVLSWTSSGQLFWPRYQAGQEAVASDAQRKREQRARDAAKARAESLGAVPPEQSRDVTCGHDSGPAVTSRDEKSRSVTNGHSDLIRSDLSRSEQITDSTPSAPVLFPLDPLPRFDFEREVYALYPRKGEGKGEGLERLEKDVKTQADFDALKQAVRNFAAHHRGLGTERKYIPHFSTWANKRWRDFVEASGLTRGAAASEVRYREWGSESEDA